MHGARVRLLVMVVVLMSSMGLSCSSSGHGPSTGNAHLGVSVRALSAADVASIVVTVSGPNISPPIVQPLSGNPTTGWSGTIANIPAGRDRVFSADARDAREVVLYSGSAAGVTIVDGQTTSITIFLEQATPPNPFTNSVPRFTSLVISDETPAPGQTVTLAVTATDPDPGDTLTYGWIASGGTLGSANAATTTWIAPNTPGVYQLVASAADPTGATATLDASLDVREEYGRGTALVEVALNTWPVVTSLVPTPARIDTGETTELALTASDPDGDALSYQWSADCDGFFSSATAEDPRFTLGPLSSGRECTLEAMIADGRGGTNTATVKIETGPPIVAGAGGASPTSGTSP